MGIESLLTQKRGGHYDLYALHNLKGFVIIGPHKEPRLPLLGKRCLVTHPTVSKTKRDDNLRHDRNLTWTANSPAEYKIQISVIFATSR